MLKNLILNLPVVKKKIAFIETAHQNEISRLQTERDKEMSVISNQYGLSDKEKVNRINQHEVKNKKLQSENDRLLKENEELLNELSVLKEEKANLFPSNRTQKLFALKHAITHEKEVTKNLKTEIASLKERLHT